MICFITSNYKGELYMQIVSKYMFWDLKSLILNFVICSSLIYDIGIPNHSI